MVARMQDRAAGAAPGWVQPDKATRGAPNLWHELTTRRSTQHVGCSPIALPALESYVRLIPVVPFGHRPANCLQASGFHS